MDPDSFLNLLSPELDELQDWACPPCSSPSSCSAEYCDAWINSHDHPFLHSKSLSALDTLMSAGNEHSDASYTSVLKLSDIAAALHGFSSKLTSRPPPPPPPPPPFASPSPSSVTNALAMAASPSSSGPPCAVASPAAAVSGQNLGRSLLVKRPGEALVADNEDDDLMMDMCNDDDDEHESNAKPAASFLAKSLRSPSPSSPSPSQSPSPSASASPPPSLGGFPSFKKLKTSIYAAQQPETTSPASSLEKPFSKDGLSQREVHIYSERQRRKSMRESFTILQSLIPKLKLKHTDRITVLTEVIKYIQALRGTLEELERKKADMMELLGITEEEAMLLGSYSSDAAAAATRGGGRRRHVGAGGDVEVAVRLCGSGVFITLNSPKRKGVWSAVLMLLHRFHVDVANATLTTSRDTSFHCIHGKLGSGSTIDGVKLQEKLEKVIIQHLERQSKH